MITMPLKPMQSSWIIRFNFNISLLTVMGGVFVVFKTLLELFILVMIIANKVTSDKEKVTRENR